MSGLRIHSLSRRFGSKIAVDKLSLEVKPGEIALLLGLNGAGKTTTLRMLMGLIPPSAGEAEVAGCSIRTDGTEVRRRVGFVPEEWGLLDYLTAREYLEMIADLRQLDRATASERMTTLLERFELAETKALVRAYSDGMKKRLGLVAALLHQPDVLLLDEPTANLDPPGAVMVADILKSFRAKGGAVLLSTHLIGDAEKIADTVFILHEGKLLASGPVADVAASAGGDLQAAFFKALGRETGADWQGLL